MATRAAPSIKRDFADRAHAFANRVPGFPMLWVAGLAAIAFMAVTGGFHTGLLPTGQRIAFWGLLIDWNLIKWQAWFLWLVRRREDWARAALIGTPLINLPLPLEIALALRVVGVAQAPNPIGTWTMALAISGVIFAVVIAARWRPKPAPPSMTGPLARAGVALDDLAAIAAEDHYCRLHRRDGTSVLIHARFVDALGDVAGIDGAQTHRGAWVAANAVTHAERDGRRWRLVVAGGARLPVSASHAAGARARGWLRRNPSAGS